MIAKLIASVVIASVATLFVILIGTFLKGLFNELRAFMQKKVSVAADRLQDSIERKIENKKKNRNA